MLQHEYKLIYRNKFYIIVARQFFIVNTFYFWPKVQLDETLILNLSIVPIRLMRSFACCPAMAGPFKLAANALTSTDLAAIKHYFRKSVLFLLG